MPDYSNSHGDLLPGAKYERGGDWDSGETGVCSVKGCFKPRYQDSLCVDHWSFKETIKPEMIFPEREGHTHPPGYFTIL